MIHISGNDILRGGRKIGYLIGNDVWSYDGKKLGFTRENDIFNQSGIKVAWVDGEYIRTKNGRKIRIADNNQQVSGGEIPTLTRAAIRVLLGD